MTTTESTSKYKAGQEWSYKTRPQEPDSTLIICRVESDEDQRPIVHISLRGLKLDNPALPGGVQSEVSHLPFDGHALDESVVNIIKEDTDLPDFEDGYKQWKEAREAGRAGVFGITVARTLDILTQGLQKCHDSQKIENGHGDSTPPRPD